MALIILNANFSNHQCEQVYKHDIFQNLRKDNVLFFVYLLQF